jgi:hypothetical protein
MSNYTKFIIKLYTLFDIGKETILAVSSVNKIFLLCTKCVKQYNLFLIYVKIKFTIRWSNS